jgi:hypothetical protein
MGLSFVENKLTLPLLSIVFEKIANMIICAMPGGTNFSRCLNRKKVAKLK